MVNKSAINRLRDVVLFLNQLLSFAPFTNEAINTVSNEVIPHLLKVIDSIDLADINFSDSDSEYIEQYIRNITRILSLIDETPPGPIENINWEDIIYTLNDLLDYVRLESNHITRIVNDQLTAYNFNLLNSLNKQVSNFDYRFSELNRIAKNLVLPQYAQVYEDEAERLEAQSCKWLIGASVSSLVFIAIIFYFLSSEIKLNLDSAIDIHFLFIAFLSLRITLILFMLYIIYFQINKYNVLRHNETVNKAKANALKTLQAFLEANKDDDTKKTILLKITEFIFSSSATGYLKDEGMNGLLKDNSLLAIVNSMVGRK